jgi:hypothetical protein
MSIFNIAVWFATSSLVFLSGPAGARINAPDYGTVRIEGDPPSK